MYFFCNIIKTGYNNHCIKLKKKKKNSRIVCQICKWMPATMVLVKKRGQSDCRSTLVMAIEKSFGIKSNNFDVQNLYLSTYIYYCCSDLLCRFLRLE